MPGFGAQRLSNLDWSELGGVSSNALLDSDPRLLTQESPEKRMDNTAMHTDKAVPIVLGGR